eukprot:TRINITY_DN2556_c0_g1_i1.p1 TRINITY_DN2556_c0_g1~~TRINITY_DN2556_c0_g1_i1.p1  ORF type:complete len:310 (+),score=59.07 TRINITY_DN2556_c0_g1_i1:45-932(+)
MGNQVPVNHTSEADVLCHVQKLYCPWVPSKIDIIEYVSRANIHATHHANGRWRLMTSKQVKDVPVSLMLRDTMIVVASVSGTLTQYDIRGHDFQTLAKRYFDMPNFISTCLYPKIFIFGATHSAWLFDLTGTLSSDLTKHLDYINLFRIIKQAGIHTHDLEFNEAHDFLDRILKDAASAVSTFEPQDMDDQIMALRFTCPRCMQIRPNSVYTDCNHIICANCMKLAKGKCLVYGTAFEDDTKFLTLPDLKLRFAIMDQFGASVKQKEPPMEEKPPLRSKEKESSAKKESTQKSHR